MQYTLNGATANARMVLFWPELLPDDIAVLSKDEEHVDSLLQQLQRDGKLIDLWTGYDGHYRVVIAIDGDFPEPYRHAYTFCAFDVSLKIKGLTCFGGIECVNKNAPLIPPDFPEVCETAAIPPGNYEAHVEVVEWITYCHGKLLREQAGMVSFVTWWLCKLSRHLVLWGAVLAFFGFFTLNFNRWTILAACEVFIVAIATIAPRTAAYRRAEEALAGFLAIVPSFYVRLTRREPAPSP